VGSIGETLVALKAKNSLGSRSIYAPKISDVSTNENVSPVM